MENEEREKLFEAGKIAAGIMEEGMERIEAGTKLLDLANFVEGEIEARGAKPAFPVNISVNYIAAHYSPQAWDESTFEKGDLVKLDIGVQMDGYIADIAKSKVVEGGGSNSHRSPTGGETEGVRKYKLIEASKNALDNAINAIKPGIKTNEVGEVIENTIKEMGFMPISNLTGHKLARWNLHSGTVIPNVKTRHGDTINEGDVYAIEPFATDGFGRVVDDPNAIIFRYVQDRPLRMKEARDILKYVAKNYETLPFAERWISGLVPRFKLNHALRQLAHAKAIYSYHILKEKNRGLVSQAEHTVIVTENGCEITTRIS
jgi:methionyl aminopeptidase